MTDQDPHANRVPLPGPMRDASRYAMAVGLATSLTALVPVATRRTHLPLVIPEPEMVYARRMSTRAFLYATCINVYLGIGVTAAACYYCEADSAYDIAWLLGRKFRTSGLAQTGPAHSVREVF
jgi:hypothetical protein